MIYCITLKSGTHRLVDLPEGIMTQILDKQSQHNPDKSPLGCLIVQPDTVVNLDDIAICQRHYPPEYFNKRVHEALENDQGMDATTRDANTIARDAYRYASIAIEAAAKHGLDETVIAEAIAKADLSSNPSDTGD